MAGIGCSTGDFLSRKQPGRKAKAPFTWGCFNGNGVLLWQGNCYKCPLKNDHDNSDVESGGRSSIEADS
jgi:hypothetical protein